MAAWQEERCRNESLSMRLNWQIPARRYQTESQRASVTLSPGQTSFSSIEWSHKYPQTNEWSHLLKHLKVNWIHLSPKQIPCPHAISHHIGDEHNFIMWFSEAPFASNPTMNVKAISRGNISINRQLCSSCCDLQQCIHACIMFSECKIFV